MSPYSSNLLAESAGILQTLTNAPIRPYYTVDFGRVQKKDGISVVVSKQDAFQLLKLLREKMPANTITFRGTSRWLGEEKHTGEEIVVTAGNDQFDILRAAQTDAVNYGIMTDQIIAKLKTYHELCGIDIFHAETDTIEFTLVRYPPNSAQFAQDIYEFCPDIVDQGLGTVDRLEDSIEITGKVYLWWD